MKRFLHALRRVFLGILNLYASSKLRRTQNHELAKGENEMLTLKLGDKVTVIAATVENNDIVLHAEAINVDRKEEEKDGSEEE